MIKPNCDYCKNELDDFGAILLSPPNGLIVKKYHICKECYGALEPKDVNTSELHLPLGGVSGQRELLLAYHEFYLKYRTTVIDSSPEYVVAAFLGKQ